MRRCYKNSNNKNGDEATISTAGQQPASCAATATIPYIISPHHKPCPPCMPRGNSFCGRPAPLLKTGSLQGAPPPGGPPAPKRASQRIAACGLNSAPAAVSPPQHRAPAAAAASPLQQAPAHVGFPQTPSVPALNWGSFFQSPQNTPSPQRYSALQDMLDCISPKFGIRKPVGYIPITPASLATTPMYRSSPLFFRVPDSSSPLSKPQSYTPSKSNYGTSYSPVSGRTSNTISFSPASGPRAPTMPPGRPPWEGRSSVPPSIAPVSPHRGGVQPQLSRFAKPGSLHGPLGGETALSTPLKPATTTLVKHGRLCLPSLPSTTEARTAAKAAAGADLRLPRNISPMPPDSAALPSPFAPGPLPFAPGPSPYAPGPSPYAPAPSPFSPAPFATSGAPLLAQSPGAQQRSAALHRAAPPSSSQQRSCVNQACGQKPGQQPEQQAHVGTRSRSAAPPGMTPRPLVLRPQRQSWKQQQQQQQVLSSDPVTVKCRPRPPPVGGPASRSDCSGPASATRLAPAPRRRQAPPTSILDLLGGRRASRDALDIPAGDPWSPDKSCGSPAGLIQRKTGWSLQDTHLSADTGSPSCTLKGFSFGRPRPASAAPTMQGSFTCLGRWRQAGGGQQAPASPQTGSLDRTRAKGLVASISLRGLAHGQEDTRPCSPGPLIAGQRFDRSAGCLETPSTSDRGELPAISGAPTPSPLLVRTSERLQGTLSALLPRARWDSSPANKPSPQQQQQKLEESASAHLSRQVLRAAHQELEAKQGHRLLNHLSSEGTARGQVERPVSEATRRQVHGKASAAVRLMQPNAAAAPSPSLVATRKYSALHRLTSQRSGMHPADTGSCAATHPQERSGPSPLRPLTTDCAATHPQERVTPSPLRPPSGDCAGMHSQEHVPSSPLRPLATQAQYLTLLARSPECNGSGCESGSRASMRDWGRSSARRSLGKTFGAAVAGPRGQQG